MVLTKIDSAGGFGFIPSYKAIAAIKTLFEDAKTNEREIKLEEVLGLQSMLEELKNSNEYITEL